MLRRRQGTGELFFWQQHCSQRLIKGEGTKARKKGEKKGVVGVPTEAGRGEQRSTPAQFRVMHIWWVMPREDKEKSTVLIPETRIGPKIDYRGTNLRWQLWRVMGGDWRLRNGEQDGDEGSELGLGEDEMPAGVGEGVRFVEPGWTEEEQQRPHDGQGQRIEAERDN